MTAAAGPARTAHVDRGRILVAVRLGTAVVGAFYLIVGLWIFAQPHSFFDTLAVFRPYSRHFLHDAGAFQTGLGVTVLAALVSSDALLVVLSGVSVASWLHVVSHVLDRNLGGRPATDIPGLVGIAVIATLAAGARGVTMGDARDEELSHR